MKKTKKISKKTAKKDSTGAKSGSFYQKYKLGVNSALIVLVIFGGWFVYSLPRMQEKQDLITKHEKLEAIADKISAVNKPDKRESSRTCGYQSQVYGKGDRYCFVNTDLEFINLSIDQANDIKNNIMQELDLKVNIENGPFGPIRDFIVDNNGVKHQSFSSNLFNENDRCSLNYAYDLSEHPDKVLYVSLSCYKSSAKAEHFPLKK